MDSHPTNDIPDQAHAATPDLSGYRADTDDSLWNLELLEKDINPQKNSKTGQPDGGPIGMMPPRMGGVRDPAGAAGAADRLGAGAAGGGLGSTGLKDETSAMVHTTPGGQLAHFGACGTKPCVDDAWIGDTNLPTEINLGDPAHTAIMDQLFRTILGTPDIVQLFIEPNDGSIQVTVTSLSSKPTTEHTPSIRAINGRLFPAKPTDLTCSDIIIHRSSSTFRTAGHAP